VLGISLHNCRERTRNAVLDLLWRQWCTLGVAGNMSAASAEHIIDLDALVLATSSLGRCDARLFDEAMDWLSQSGFLVNLHRVKNLHKRVGLGDEQVLEAMADWLWINAGQPRWKLFVEKKAEGQAEDMVPLFKEQGDMRPRQPDAIFGRHGLERNFFEPRGMSRMPDSEHPANLMPKLRALMGVSARVEIMLYLGGTAGSSHATEVAQATGYSPRTLQVLLQEMQMSGQVLGPPKSLDEDAPIRRGVNRSYSLSDDLSEFLSPRMIFPEWKPWTSIFRISEAVLELFPADGKDAPPLLVVSSGLREVLMGEFKTLVAHNLWHEMSLRLDAKGESLLGDFCIGFPKLLERLGGKDEG
jgi:hypothetical protein